ncbi:hypothetical protein ABC974_16705 [Sphingomonas oligophenolica]|uniref:Uncharacterized protein n=1 Tax=Sphingomonas oligophenolica TaxID=301154 RepID=A0ABU9Y640_9SPHN
MTDIPNPETDFLLRRAEQEAILAIRTNHADAAAPACPTRSSIM